MIEITLEAVVQNLDTVTEFVNEYLESLDCPMKVQMAIDIVIDEIFSNISHYAYSDKIGMVTVKAEETTEPHGVVLTFVDKGMAYNPLEKEDPDITLSAEERAIGGMGLLMVKKMTDEMSYEYTNGENHLQIRKNF